MLDLVIRNGLVIDGTGRAGFRGDVGVAGARIREVGRISTPARRTIDAEGHLVTPGFVDIHTHYDGQVSWDGVLAPSSFHGVTSIAMGNCGVGFAPARREAHDWLIALLEGVEDIPGTALAEGLTWDWETFPEYLNALERRRFTMDVGAHFPHAAVRTYVMGERGGNHEVEPTDDEIARMAALAGEALASGALGFTTSRTYLHRSRNGENIGTLTAGDRELLGIAAALGASGRGVIQLISDAYLTPDDRFAEAELALIARLARTARRPLSFTVQQTDDAPDRWRFILERVQRLVDDGLAVKAQVAPRPIGVILSFASTINPFLLCPGYRALLSLAPAERAARLADPDVKARILAEHATRPGQGVTALIAHGFSRMYRLTDPVDYEPSPESALAAEARRAGRDEADYVYDVFLEAGGERLIYQPLINYARGDLADTYAMMTAPHTLYGLSDGGAHCGTISDASFPTTSLALWSRGNRQGQRIAVEALVHGYTARNAQHIGWHDRGVLAPGYQADVNIIDLEALAVPPPVLSHDLPAGGTRLMQTARGYRATIKSGVVTFENGRWMGTLPGRLLRGETASPA